MIELYPYQEKAIKAILDSTEKRMLVTLPTGCISGDSLIGINRSGKGKSISIKEAFYSQFDKRYQNKIPTKVRVFKNDHIGLHEIINIKESGIKKTYKLTLGNGKFIRATEDHKILTTDGYFPLCNLNDNHLVICAGDNVYSGYNKKSYKLILGMKYHKYHCNTFARRKRGNNIEGYLYRVPYHRAVYEADLNKISIEEFIYICRTDPMNTLKFLDPKTYAIHHKNCNHKCNEIDNLECLTHEEHWSLHGKEKNHLNFKDRHTCDSKVLRIDEPYEEMTYDISCTYPYHNFLANGIVVHNCGKTILFLEAIKRLNKKTLVLAHRNELIRQTLDKALNVGIFPEQLGEYSFSKKETDPQIIIGSVQTCIRHISELEDAEFECMVIDEVHHAAADSYQKLIHELGFFDGSKYLLGFTATPIRGDHLSLGDTFPAWVYNMTLEEAVVNGYISDLKGIWINIKADLKGIRSQAGDYSARDLEEEINTYAKNNVVSQSILKHAEGRKAIAFCVTVQHAQDLCLSMREAGIAAAVISGDMDMDSREDIYTLFREGHLNALVSCMVLTEGFDMPEVDCVIMARPTRSPSLYRQMVGRGMRKYPGKDHCLVLEFTSNDKKMLSLEDISPNRRIAKIKSGETFKEALEREEKETIDKKINASRVYAIETEIYDPLDRRNKPVFVVEPLGSGDFYVPHHFGFYYAFPETIDGQFHFNVMDHVSIGKIYFPKGGFYSNSFEEAVQQIQSSMFRRNIRKFYPEDGEPITDRQRELLQHSKVPCEGISKREASKRIERLFIVKFLNMRYSKEYPKFED